LVRAPADIVARLKESFHKHPEFGKPVRQPEDVGVESG
jgi:hypothetical protein